MQPPHQQVKCLYCGKYIDATLAHCPHCNGTSHAQQRGYRVGERERFIILVILVTLFCSAAIILLPRTSMLW
ncbi:MAG: protein nirD [Gammaproteobacteria bacterium]|nr:protein nirD [Gammaproteobacteria bacterium]